MEKTFFILKQINRSFNSTQSMKKVLGMIFELVLITLCKAILDFDCNFVTCYFRQLRTLNQCQWHRIRICHRHHRIVSRQLISSQCHRQCQVNTHKNCLTLRQFTNQLIEFYSQVLTRSQTILSLHSQYKYRIIQVN